jgi:hypothetical protein
VQPICIVVSRVVSDPETFQQCNALLKHLLAMIFVRHDSCRL